MLKQAEGARQNERSKQLEEVDTNKVVLFEVLSE